MMIGPSLVSGVVAVLVLLAIGRESACQSISLGNIYITWTNRGLKTDFTITSPLDNGVKPSNAWIAVGLNSAPKMGGATVVACSNWNGRSALQHYYNSPTTYSSNWIDPLNPTIGISNAAINTGQGNLTCSFTRENMFNSVASTGKYFDLNMFHMPYILAAFGTPKSDGTIAYHSKRFMSQQPVDLGSTFKPLMTQPPFSIGSVAILPTQPSPVFFTTQQSTQSSTTTSTTTRQQTTSSTAPTLSFATITSGQFQSGSYVVSWKTSEIAIDFSIVAKTTSSINTYVAIGFSTDTNMGQDDVYACVYAANFKGVSRYFNNGHKPVKAVSTNGIANTHISLSNGVLTCSFSRLKRMSSDDKFFDLSSKYYLLNSFGATDDAGNILRHSSTIVSPNQIDFLSGPSPKTTDILSTAATRKTDSIKYAVLLVSASLIFAIGMMY